MEKDRLILNQLSPQQKIVHLYDWQGDSATYGHFVNPAEHFNPLEVRKAGLYIAQRPTGGGIIFHFCDFAYSVFVGCNTKEYRTNTLESYALVNQWIASLIEREFHVQSDLVQTVSCADNTAYDRFCMARSTKYDLVVQGRKVGGAAQRRTKNGILHQGTICLTLPSKEYLQCILLNHDTLGDAMKKNSFPLLGPNAARQDLQHARKALRQQLRSASFK